jgi:hypothetical protein
MPVVSANMAQGGPLTSWLQCMAPVLSIHSGILKLIHPSQYHGGTHCLSTLRRMPQFQTHVERWPSVFNAMAVVANRETLYHRDGDSHRQWFDLLATYGNYSKGQFSVPGIGVDFAYGPGTVIAFCGNILRHGVPHCDGDRVCIAQYMRARVHDRMGSKNVGWSYAHEDH